MYSAAGALQAVSFDIERLEVVGGPTPVVENVGTKSSGASSFDVSENGTLVYAPSDLLAGRGHRIVWVDREGREEVLRDEPQRWGHPQLSPDGQYLALDKDGTDIWVLDLSRGTSSRLTFDDAQETYPLWTTDGRRVMFASRTKDGENGIFWRAADGTSEVERIWPPLSGLAVADELSRVPSAVSPDGALLVFTRRAHPDTKHDIGVISLPDGEREEMLLEQPFNELWPDLSPDGQWLAYSSDETGTFEVFVRPFPDVDQGKWQISTHGGNWPAWSPDGRELYYYNANRMTVVPIEVEPSFSAGTPQFLFEGDHRYGGGRHFDVALDGKRLVLLQGNDWGQLNVAINWFQELKAHVPTEK